MRRSFLISLCCLIAIFLLTLPIPAEAMFTDVPSGSWYENVVRQMTASGWLTGYSDNTFRPTQSITGAEFVTLVTRRAGIQPVEGPSEHWASGYMQAALDCGWYDWDEFPPSGEHFDQPISRQLAVKILMRALCPDAKGEYAEEAPKIRDLAALDGRYYDAVFAAYANGIVTGDSDGFFRPKDGLSRAETCALMQRAAENPPAAPTVSAQTSAPAIGTGTPPTPETTVKGGVSQNGWLQVKGTQLCNEAGTPIVLHGMSTHGLQWYSQFASAESIRSTAAYGANLFRVAMYTAEGGYISLPETMKAKAVAAVDAAIANDMYVILDWHILSDGNPMTYITEAEAFFTEMAARYKDSPAVLYEICNEPNGDVTWERDIRPYAEKVLAVIRAQSPRAVVLVGSGTWSQDLHFAAQNPLAGGNILYTCHFYAGTHGAWLRERIDNVLQQGLPVFVSEWGTSSADGSGGVFLDESSVWLDFLEQRGISWANWSLCDKAETSAALRPGASSSGPWTQEDLTESGLFVFSRF